MNGGEAVKAATKAVGGSTASNISNAATKGVAESGAVSSLGGASHKSLPDIESKSSSSLPQGKTESAFGDSESITGSLKSENSSVASEGENAIESNTNSSPNSESVNETGETPVQEGESPEELEARKNEQEKELNDNHKQINPETGEVEDNAKVKMGKAAVTAAATYFGQGKGAQIASNLNESGMLDKAYGVIDDATSHGLAGKALDQAAETLDEAGVSDGINDIAKTYASATNGDIKGTIDGAKDVKKDVKKLNKFTGKTTLKFAISGLVPLIFVAIVIGAACGPILGGFMDATNPSSEYVDDGNFGEDGGGEKDPGKDPTPQDVEKMLQEIPGFNNLSEARKAILTAAATGIASGRPYNWGGKPTGPGIDGLPRTGVDCSGFVQWALWTGLGSKPSASSTAGMVSSIGSDYIEISASELQPGDIALKNKGSGSNHTGIYGGNGMWFHAANSKTGLVRSKYSSFTVYLRYKGV